MRRRTRSRCSWVARRAASSDPVTTYARAMVRSPKGVARLVVLACKRHLADLKRKDLFWDSARSAWAIEFFSHLRHTKGPKAGTPFILEPWQAFIVGNLFGWRLSGAGGGIDSKLTGENRQPRRFRVAYIEVPRKNGKSTLS